MGVSEQLLFSMQAQIDLCDNKPYNPKNKTMAWNDEGNDRYPDSLAGEVANYLYVMHVLKTSPPWVDVIVAGSKQEQSGDAVDLIVDDGDKKTTVQLKTGKSGSYGDIVYDTAWFKGQPDHLVAVDWPKGRFYRAPFEVWKRLSKGRIDKFIPKEEFVTQGGEIIDCHPDVVNLVKRYV